MEDHAEQPITPAATDAAPSELSADALVTEICTLAGQLASAMCRWLLLLAELDRRGEWSDGATKTCADWLSWRCSIMPATAREHLRVARRLVELPLVTRSFASGALSYSKVRAITRVAEPATEEQLVLLAEHASGAVLERLVRGYRRSAAACLESAEIAHERRYLRWEWAEDGSLRFRGRLPPDDGALLLAALQRAESGSEGQEDDNMANVAEGEHEDTATRYRNRSADALVTVARASLSAERSSVAGVADPCQVVVHVDAETLAADDVVERTDLDNGPSLLPETVRRLACDASIVRIIERDGRPLTVGRRTRTVSPALRRALHSLDRACRFPGCSHTRFLHAHHVKHWARGGNTDISNLVMLCSHHHRLVHEGDYGVELTDLRDGPEAADPRRGAPGAQRRGPRSTRARRVGSSSPRGPALRFLRPDGSVIPEHHLPVPLTGPSVSERADRGQITIDADSCRAKSAAQRCDRGIAIAGLLDRTLRARGRDPGTIAAERV